MSLEKYNVSITGDCISALDDKLVKDDILTRLKHLTLDFKQVNTGTLVNNFFVNGHLTGNKLTSCGQQLTDYVTS